MAGLTSHFQVPVGPAKADIERVHVYAHEMCLIECLHMASLCPCCHYVHTVVIYSTVWKFGSVCTQIRPAEM